MLYYYYLGWWLVAMAYGGCPALKYPPKETKRLRKEAIKIQILSKLRRGEQVTPNVTREKLNFHMRWQMDDYYNSEVKKRQADSVHSRNTNDDRYFSKTVKVFRFPEETILTPNTRHYQFDPKLNGKYSATGAQLKLSISQKDVQLKGKKASLRIYKLATPLSVLQDNPHDLEQLLNRPIHTTRIRNILGSKEHTYEYDFTMAFNRWTQWSDSNYGILICVGKCFDKDPRQKFDDVILGNVEGHRPLLSIDTYEENHTRKKRSGSDCANPRQQKKCCRYHYYVKFADLGMDWILAPEGYDAYYCSGECPFMYLSESTSSLYYTFVIARANYNNPHASPQPCCTPATLSYLSIMFSSGNVDAQGQPTDIEIHNLEDMIVEECGCS